MSDRRHAPEPEQASKRAKLSSVAVVNRNMYPGQDPMGNMGYPGGDAMGYGGPGMDPSMGGMGPPGMGMGPMGMGGPMGMMERIFPCVKLRGLPFDVSEDDVRMFLGCDPVDVLMVKRDGRLSGEAFVLLASPMQIELALSKNRTYLGRRYIEVYRAKKSDYYRGVAQEVAEGGAMGGPGPRGGYHGDMGYGGMEHGGYGHGGHGGMQHGGAAAGFTSGDTAGTTILKLRGLPFSISDDDIVRWFDDPALGITPITADSVFIVSEGGRPSGIAFVEFPSAQEATAAMGKNKQSMGSRYIEIFPASRADLEKYRNRGGY